MKNILDFSKNVTAGDIEEMIRKGADPNVRSNAGRTPFMMAICYGYDSAADALVKAGADINSQDDKGNTALMIAAYSGLLSVIKKLHAMGADFNLIDNVGGNALTSVVENLSIPTDIQASILTLLFNCGAVPTEANLEITVIDKAYQDWLSNKPALLNLSPEAPVEHCYAA